MSDGFLNEEVVKAAGAGALGLLGRLIAMSRMDRRPFGWSLLWEIPTAVGMGIIGSGLADYLELKNFAHHAMTISVGYIGPRLVDEIFNRWLPPKPPIPGGQ